MTNDFRPVPSATMFGVMTPLSLVCLSLGSLRFALGFSSCTEEFSVLLGSDTASVTDCYPTL
jgi:hypothetical protein